jgi:glycosyltransferase involved in cell wall biosynthesis
MKKLKVGVWVANYYKPEIGGGYGYLDRLLNALSEYNFENADIVFIAKDFPENWNKYEKSYKIKTKNFIEPQIGTFGKLRNKIYKSLKLQPIQYDFSHSQEKAKRTLEKELSAKVDLLYFLTPELAPQVNLELPFIYTLWDIGHKISYPFPELTMHRKFEIREQAYTIFPQKAIAVFCESETGRKDAIFYLNLNNEKIKIVNLFPSRIVENKVKSIKPPKLDDNIIFIHYPAQFWAHKNHYNLILAFKVVLDSFPSLKLVFTGSDKGNKQYIFSVIKNLQLEESIIDLGFIDQEELKWLYENSLGLVMPTFLGPTNMPLLEAAELNCKVACSDLPGHYEQLGDYAYYFKPNDVENIAQKITEMLNSEKKHYSPKFTFENSLKSIDRAFSEIQSIRFCWE